MSGRRLGCRQSCRTKWSALAVELRRAAEDSALPVRTPRRAASRSARFIRTSDERFLHCQSPAAPGFEESSALSAGLLPALFPA